MKTIERLITSREMSHELYMDLIYEWEDEFKRNLSIPFFYERSFRGRRWVLKIIDKFPFFSFLLLPKQQSFIFELSDYRQNCLNNASNIIPCIVDFYVNDSGLDYFVRMHRNNRVVFVTSRQAYDYLSTKHLPFVVKHLPLSLPSKYKITPLSHFEKKYDLLIIGRPNPVLLSFVERYAALNADFLYVYRKSVEGHYTYFSNHGECLGNKDNRSDYFNLLREAKVCLYSTSGMDNDKCQTNGYHQVTPRFFEMLASGCHVIARYERNSDTDYYEMSKYWPSVENYEQFSDYLDSYLRESPNMDFYSKYLANHYTEVRIELVKRTLKGIDI